ncbi:hypothetical protein L1987_28883 [Smallanthus sonchifolius]|uniref:Uncharacterized protein n=1 Tax=Smallanthus sonchifolius TaxID=185202 RepID=A0ACB9I147_9ASTR|nr:hypothetical protein L1987_28883 [Smallanthus sonchifolius]
MVVYEEIDHHEALNVSVKKHDVYLTIEEHCDSLICEKVLSGANGSNAGSTNKNENPSELSKLDNPDNLNVAKKMTAEPEGIEENISTTTTLWVKTGRVCCKMHHGGQRGVTEKKFSYIQVHDMVCYAKSEESSLLPKFAIVPFSPDASFCYLHYVFASAQKREEKKNHGDIMVSVTSPATFLSFKEVF